MNTVAANSSCEKSEQHEWKYFMFDGAYSVARCTKCEWFTCANYTQAPFLEIIFQSYDEVDRFLYPRKKKDEEVPRMCHYKALIIP